LPFTRSERVSAGRGNQPSTDATCPSFIKVVDKDSLRICVANAVKVIAIGIAGSDWVLGKQRQVAAQRDQQSV
jgi:hypothetical protein